MAVGMATQTSTRSRGGGGRNGSRERLPMDMMWLYEFRRNVVVAFIAIAGFAPLLWMVMDRDPPYRFEQVEISPADAVQGSEIHITFTVRPNRAPCSPGLVYREFKEVASSRLFIYDPILRSEAPALVNNSFTRISKLPIDIAPGPALYRGMACYTCNPIHSWLRWPVCVTTPNVQFNILDKTNNAK